MHPTRRDAPAARSSAPDQPSSRLRSRRRCRPRHCHHRHRRRPRSPLRAPSTSRSAPERGQSRPSENGFAPSPRTAATRPSSTSSTSVQAPGHSSQTTIDPQQGRGLSGRRASSVPAGSSATSSSAQARFGSKPHAALPAATAPAPARKPLRVNFMDERLLRTGPRPASASLFTPCLLEPSFSHKRPSCGRSKTPSARRRRDAHKLSTIAALICPLMRFILVFSHWKHSPPNLSASKNPLL